MPELLIELFSEEMPARMQPRARAELKARVTDGLVAAGLTYRSAGVFSTPRRLALVIEELSAQSPTLREERRGPRADAPEAAIAGFVRATGVAREDLEPRTDKKGSFLYATMVKPGRQAEAIVAEVLEEVIRNFPWPKSMRWGAGSLRWVRPLHSILCILADEEGARTVPLTIDGIVAGDTTAGHRFMAPGRFRVRDFDDYATKLRAAKVMLDPAERETHIRSQAENLAFAQGLEIVPDDALLTEIAGLVEWPVVLIGPIGAAFLDLPPEVLQTSMREHQKFLSVRNPATGRIEKFVTVANRDTADDGATILKGNEKVLAARLSDAKFFWENDLRVVGSTGLEGMAAGLENVTFHNRLGSQADRIRRIEVLAREIAPRLDADAELAAQAARIAKADLQSEMVGEFPELQGIMGGYYARAAGLPDAVADACAAHYQPLGPSDPVPDGRVAAAVALADKLDTLAGFWAIDEKPTGSKDPFALRRAALGVIRIVLAHEARLPLVPVMASAFRPFGAVPAPGGAEGAHSDMVLAERVAALHEQHISEQRAEAAGEDARAPSAGGTEEATRADLLGFFHDRLKVHLRDRGIRHDVIDACLALPGSDDLALVAARAGALSRFLQEAEGHDLLQGFRRASNILAQAEAGDGVTYSFGADPKFAESDAERTLFSAIGAAESRIAPAMEAGDYAAALAAMADLRTPIDAFFEAVQVNSDNPVVRRNRLNLLNQIRETCNAVADLTRIEG